MCWWLVVVCRELSLVVRCGCLLCVVIVCVCVGVVNCMVCCLLYVVLHVLLDVRRALRLLCRLLFVCCCGLFVVC